MDAGNYRARIQSCGIGQTKNETPFVAVNLAVETPNGTETAQWNGYLHTEKSLKITEKALAVMGMTTPDYAALAGGLGLDAEKVFSITVIDETTESGKVYQKVQWINELGSGGKSELLDKGAALKLLANLGLASSIAASAANKKITTGDIPF